MSWRDTLNNNSAVVTIGAVALLVIALGIMIMTLTGGGGGSRSAVPTGMYFYDLGSKKIYTVPLNTLAPAKTETGEGVEIVIMTCSKDGCGGKDFSGMTIEEVAQAGDYFVAYLQKYPDDIKKQMEAMQAKNEGVAMLDMMPGSPLVRRIDNEQWLNSQNPRHQQSYTNLMKSLRDKCPQGQHPRRCLPGQ